MRTDRISLVLLLAVLAAAPAPAQSLSGDLAKIQGRWWARSQPAGGGRSVVTFMEVKGDVVTGTLESGDATSVGPVRLNESASPRTIDLVDTVVSSKVIKNFKMHDLFGIYETDGETLKVALNSGIVNSRWPTAFKVDSKVGIAVMTYHRGEPTPEPESMPKAAAKPAKPVKVERAASFPGATVLGIVDRKVHFRAGDGTEFVTGVIMEKIYDAQGKPFRNGLYFMWPGNLVDVPVVYSDSPVHADQIKEVRVVRGKSDKIVLEDVVAKSRGAGQVMPRPHVTYAADPDGAGQQYQGAVITGVEPMKVTLDVGGKTVDIGRTNRNTVAIDGQGNTMAIGQQARLLRVGNKVDVDVRPKRKPDDPTELPIIRSIRLLEGQLADPVQYLNSPAAR
jgi:uncharacterized protein (TIGR03067 family)